MNRIAGLSHRHPADETVVKAVQHMCQVGVHSGHMAVPATWV